MFFPKGGWENQYIIKWKHHHRVKIYWARFSSISMTRSRLWNVGSVRAPSIRSSKVSSPVPALSILSKILAKVLLSSWISASISSAKFCTSFSLASAKVSTTWRVKKSDVGLREFATENLGNSRPKRVLQRCQSVDFQSPDFTARFLWHFFWESGVNFSAKKENSEAEKQLQQWDSRRQRQVWAGSQQK